MIIKMRKCVHQLSAPPSSHWPLPTETPQNSCSSPSWPGKVGWGGRKVQQGWEAGGPEADQCKHCLGDQLLPRPPASVPEIVLRWRHQQRTQPDGLAPQEPPENDQLDCLERLLHENKPVVLWQMLQQTCRCPLWFLDPELPFKIKVSQVKRERVFHLATRVAERIKVDRSLNTRT